MLSTRVGRRGQITLPREVRRRINVREGDQIAFVIEGGQVVIKLAFPARPARQCTG